jgi:predicted small secreted protein
MTPMIDSPMKRWLIPAALLVASCLFSSCNTMEGVGEDIQHAGHHIEHAAQ